MSFLKNILFKQKDSHFDSIIDLGNKFSKAFGKDVAEESIQNISAISDTQYYKNGLTSLKNENKSETLKKTEQFIIENLDLIEVAQKAKSAEEGNDYMNAALIMEKRPHQLNAIEALVKVNLKNFNTQRSYRLEVFTDWESPVAKFISIK